jgi:hypothetical protein
MTATTRNAPLWSKLGELASRWRRRHDDELVTTEYNTRREAHNDLAAQLAAQVDPALRAEVVRTRALAEQARAALTACQYDLEIVPGVPGLTWEEDQERRRRVSAAHKRLPSVELAARNAYDAHREARNTLEHAVGALCAPIAGAAAQRVPEAERAAQQLVRDAREDARWAATLAGDVLYRVNHPQEQPE